ncbi:MAG: hypothetical protein K0B10_10515 [Vicingaceae bacterium]|nr:hypothetical protein [Vicingaceae bacterium]
MQVNALVASYNNIIDGNISWDKFKKTRKIIISDSLGRNKKYKLLAVDATTIKNGYLTIHKFGKEISKEGMDFFFKIYKPEIDVYFTNIRFINKKTKEVIYLNDIHLTINNKINVKPKTHYSLKIFPNHQNREIQQNKLLKLNEIPLEDSSNYKIIHYTFSYIFQGNRYEIEVNSNKITPPMKEIIAKLYHNSRINFENIIVKDRYNNIYQLPMKRFIIKKDN